MYFASQHAATAWAGEADFDPIQETSALGKSDRTLSPVEIMSMSYQDVLNEPLIECGEKLLARHHFYGTGCRSQGQAQHAS